MENYGVYVPTQVLTVLLLTFAGLLEVCVSVSEPSSIPTYTNMCGRTIDISGPDQAGMIVVDYDRAMSFGGLRRWTCDVKLITRDVGEQIALRFIAGKSTYQCQNILECFCNSSIYINLGINSFLYCMPPGSKNSSVKQSYDSHVQLTFLTMGQVSGSFSVLFSPFTRLYDNVCAPSKIKCDSEKMCISRSIRCSHNDYGICDDSTDVCNNQPSNERDMSLTTLVMSVVVVIVLCTLLFAVCYKYVCRQRSSCVSKLCNNRSTTTRANSRSDQEMNRDVFSIILERRDQMEAEASEVNSRTESRERETVHHSLSRDRPPGYSSAINRYQEAPPPSYEQVISNQEAYNVTDHG